MRHLAIAALAVLFVCTSAMAVLAETKDNPVNSESFDPTDCPVDGYKSLSQTLGVSIPDADPAGTGLLGPIQFPPDGTVIQDVIIDLEIEHTWVGDLIVQVSYDLDCDGVPDAGDVALLCRQNLDGCEPTGCCGCSGDLLGGGTYFFSDDGGKEMTNSAAQCPTVIPFGCYKPASDGGATLGRFDGLPKDGCWWISAIDGAGGDTGTLLSWSVHLLNQGGTPVEPASWGAIKAEYND